MLRAHHHAGVRVERERAQVTWAGSRLDVVIVTLLWSLMALPIAGGRQGASPPLSPQLAGTGCFSSMPAFPNTTWTVDAIPWHAVSERNLGLTGGIEMGQDLLAPSTPEWLARMRMSLERRKPQPSLVFPGQLARSPDSATHPHDSQAASQALSPPSVTTPLSSNQPTPPETTANDDGEKRLCQGAQADRSRGESVKSGAIQGGITSRRGRGSEEQRCALTEDSMASVGTLSEPPPVRPYGINYSKWDDILAADDDSLDQAIGEVQGDKRDVSRGAMGLAEEGKWAPGGPMHRKLQLAAWHQDKGEYDAAEGLLGEVMAASTTLASPGRAGIDDVPAPVMRQYGWLLYTKRGKTEEGEKWLARAAAGADASHVEKRCYGSVLADRGYSSRAEIVLRQVFLSVIFIPRLGPVQ